MSEPLRLRARTAESWLQAWQASHSLPHYRPARVRPFSTQRVPRRIFQTSKNATQELTTRGAWMSSWWELNPEYSYHIFDDADMFDFVMRFCNPRERAAFMRSLVGAQRADLFRVYLLRELGGLYTDTDSSLRRPLREWHAVATAAGRPPRLERGRHEWWHRRGLRQA